jgi:uncharacterized protein (DUF2384 family)
MRTPFKKKPKASPLSDEARVRQGRVVKAAQAALPSTESALAFLNSHQGLLGGRPLDLAIASDAGLLRVEQYVAARADIEAAAHGGPPPVAPQGRAQDG